MWNIDQSTWNNVYTAVSLSILFYKAIDQNVVWMGGGKECNCQPKIVSVKRKRKWFHLKKPGYFSNL